MLTARRCGRPAAPWPAAAPGWRPLARPRDVRRRRGPAVPSRHRERARMRAWATIAATRRQRLAGASATVVARRAAARAAASRPARTSVRQRSHAPAAASRSGDGGDDRQGQRILRPREDPQAGQAAPGRQVLDVLLEREGERRPPGRGAARGAAARPRTPAYPPAGRPAAGGAGRGAGGAAPRPRPRGRARRRGARARRRPASSRGRSRRGPRRAARRGRTGRRRPRRGRRAPRRRRARRSAGAEAGARRGSWRRSGPRPGWYAITPPDRNPAPDRRSRPAIGSGPNETQSRQSTAPRASLPACRSPPRSSPPSRTPATGSPRPRRALADLIAARGGSTFTAADLVADVRARRLGIGRATVFRAIDLLESVGAVERIDLQNGEHAYVACMPTHHHHVICARCARATEIGDLGLGAVAREVSPADGLPDRRAPPGALRPLPRLPAARRRRPDARPRRTIRMDDRHARRDPA